MSSRETECRENRKKGEKRSVKKTLRRELTRLVMITSTITLFIVGGGVSAAVFHRVSKTARDDLELYMASIHEQFAEKLLFLEEGMASLHDSDLIFNFLSEEEIDEASVKEALENKINLYADRNLIDSEYPIVKDLYVYNGNKRGIGTHFYPMTNSEDKFMEWHLKNELTVYLTHDVPFYYQKNGTDLDCIFPIYNEDLYEIGYCCVIFDLDSIQRIYDQLEKYETYYWTFETPDKRRLAGTGIPQELSEASNGSGGLVKVGNESYYFSVKNNGFGLTSYVMVPKNKIYLTMHPVFQMAWIIAFSLFFVIMIVIQNFGKKISVPMRNLVEKINRFGTGDFETRFEEYDIKELQQISTSFNEMASKLEHLIKEVYETKLIAQETKIQYLQAQINPHFFFNVLSAIAIRLKMSQQEELYQMINAFAGLMQGKLFRKNEIEIQAEKEVEIVGFYLYLQGERFKDIITYEIVWEDEALKECYIPRLSIEPLVENAVIHGLEPKGEPGHICVQIAKAGADLLVTVTDDGVGFNMEEYMNSEENRNPRVGIMNIRRLIQNLYGKEYGLDYDSKPGEGTQVVLRVPFHKDRIC